MAPHTRKCQDCGNVATHTDNITPEVLCKKCGSQDTRLVRSPRKYSAFECTVYVLDDERSLKGYESLPVDAVKNALNVLGIIVLRTESSWRNVWQDTEQAPLDKAVELLEEKADS